MIPGLKLRRLRIALAVGAAGSFSAAASRLGLSQPAVSRAVARLEGAVGEKLFTRGVSASPTPAGEILARRVRRALSLLEAISEAVAEHAADHELAAAMAVEASGSLTVAAQQLGVSQSALSHSLAMIERRIGRRLFDRKGHGVRPRPGAARDLRHMRLALTEIEHALEEIRFARGASDGTLRIGALPLARPSLLPNAVNKVLEIYPDARIAIVDGTYEALQDNLLNARLDAIVGSLRPPQGDGLLTTHPLFSDGFAIVAARGHPLFGRELPALADLVEEDWVLPFPEVPLRKSFEAMLRRAGLQMPRRYVETDSITVVRAMLAKSRRLTIVSDHQISEDVKLGLLARVPIPIDIAPRRIGITLRTQYQQTPLFEALVAALTVEAERYVRSRKEAVVPV